MDEESVNQIPNIINVRRKRVVDHVCLEAMWPPEFRRGWIASKMPPETRRLLICTELMRDSEINEVVLDRMLGAGAVICDIRVRAVKFRIIDGADGTCLDR